MPRSDCKVFKKRKRVFAGRSKCCKNNECAVQSEELTPRPTTSNANSECEPPQCKVSTSSKKLSHNLDLYQSYKDKDVSNACYDIVAIKDLQSLLSKIAVCSKCQGPLTIYPSSRLGLSVVINIKCSSCNFEVSERNTKRVKKKSAVNVRLAYAFRCIGKGEEAARNFCAVMNLPNPPEFKHYTNILLEATKSVCTESMKNAVEQTVEETGSRDITAIFDGSWQRRGHASQNGIVSAISEATRKVIDIRMFTKSCTCKLRLENKHEANCIANYIGVSGGMEVKGIVDMFEKSKETHNIRYKYFLGDGDSSAYPTVVEKKPYGEDVVIEKLECVGHVQKRMGSRLRKLKTQMGKTKLDDGKTMGGRGRLTNVAINEIQNYYGLAIRRNAGTTLQQMKTAVWAEFFHLLSSNDSPAHELCPGGPDSWCKYRKAKANNEPYDHREHTHFPRAVMEKMKPIFQDLAHPDLLRRCLHGGTQNASESLNSVIWSRLPKSTFVRKKTLELGVFEAVATYNEGNIIRCRILEKLGIPPGKNCIARMELLDKRRIKKADKAIEEIEKMCRQKKTLAKRRLEDQYEEEEDPDNPSYGAGMH